MRYGLVDLKLFVAVADECNVTRGAARCFLAPSSASLRIRQLEDSLGTPLFTRAARGVALTRAGQVMLEHCRRSLAELEQMHASLAPYAQGIKTQVTMFANSSAIAAFLPADLAVYFKTHPDVRVALEERLSHDICAAVAEGRADLGVVTWADAHPQLQLYPYREDELVALSPRGGPWPKARRISFSQCLGQPFISLRPGAAIHTFLAGKAAALGQRLDIRVQVGSFAAVVALVQSGAGVAIVPRSVLDAINTDGVRVLGLQEAWAERHLQVCVKRGQVLNPQALDLLRVLCPSVQA